MKTLMTALALMLLATSPVFAQQPAPAMTTTTTTQPAAMTAAPAPAAMTAAPTPTPAMTAAPAPAPAMPVAPAPATTPAPPPAMTAAPAPPAQPTMSAAPPTTTKKSTDSKATFWLTLLTPLVIGVLTFVLTYLNGKNKLEALKTERAKMILGFVQTAVASFVRYSEGTKAEWDDAVAKLLSDVNNALIAAGQEPLSPVEKSQVEAQAQAQRSLEDDDKKVAAPKEDDAKSEDA